MEKLEKIKIAESEYEKLYSNPQVDKKLLNHPSFRKTFIKAFEHLNDENEFKVEIVDGLVQVTFEEKPVTQSIEESTNENVEIYHGYSNLKRYRFSLDSKKDDYLLVKADEANIYNVDENSMDHATANYRISAYKGEYEVGYITCFRSTMCFKYSFPLMFLNSHIYNPGLTLDVIERGLDMIKTKFDNRDTYALSACHRASYDGLVHKTSVNNYIDRNYQAHYTETNGWGVINKDNPTEMYRNITIFAATGKEKQTSETIYYDNTGTPISPDDLENMKISYSEEFSKPTAREM